MRLKVTIGFTIVCATLFVIALMYEGEPATNTPLDSEVNVAAPNQLEQLVSLDYSGYSQKYVVPHFSYDMFMLRMQE